MNAPISFTYPPHAMDMIETRGIERAWVERTVLQPDITEPDKVYSDRIRAFARVPERGGRVLRVVYVRTDDEVRIVTLFFDRGRRLSPC